MKLYFVGNLRRLAFVALCIVSITRSYAEPDKQVETGRLQLCKIAESPTHLNEIEIPVDGRYVIPGAKAGALEPIIVTQTDFLPALDLTAQAKNNGALIGRYKLENRNGKFLVHIALNGSNCIYLNASAPVLARSDLTLSGSRVVPDWAPESDGVNVAGVSYRYFGSIDQTYYVASEVGKILSFGVHESQVGSNLSHDKIRKTPTMDSHVLNLLPQAFKANLERRNQYDINLFDLEKASINVENLDFDNAAELGTFVAQVIKAMQPPPNSRVIVALPKKGTVKLKFTNTTLFGNKLEGLGFYRDANLHIIYDSEHDDYVPIDAFINFRAAVIDLDSGKLIASGSFADGWLFFSPPESESELAGSISDSKKINALSRIANLGVAKMMGDLFVAK